MEQKKQLGQFFTKGADYIFQGFGKYVRNKSVADPFAGAGDLIVWANKNGAKKTLGYDVDKKYVNKKNVFFNDSILTPKKYPFVVTNPPYLNVNKADSSIKQRYFNKFEHEDLYHISLASIIGSEEGIVIVPINFLSAENSRKIRDLFFSEFRIVEMNYFKNQVFSDTTYNVISFYYKRKKNIFENSFNIKCRIFPEGRTTHIRLEKCFHWTIGGETLTKIESQKNTLGIHRLTEDMLGAGDFHVKAAYNHIDDIREYKVSSDTYKKIKNNLILLRAIDSGTPEGKIRLENIRDYGLDCLVSKESSRNMIYLIFDNHVSVEKQKEIIKIFNGEMEKLRKEHSSLFLTNFRDNDRKRVSFDFVYKFINHIYFNKIEVPKIISLFSLKQYEQVG